MKPPMEGGAGRGQISLTLIRVLPEPLRALVMDPPDVLNFSRPLRRWEMQASALLLFRLQ